MVMMVVMGMMLMLMLYMVVMLGSVIISMAVIDGLGRELETGKISRRKIEGFEEAQREIGMVGGKGWVWKS